MFGATTQNARLAVSVRFYATERRGDVRLHSTYCAGRTNKKCKKNNAKCIKYKCITTY